MISIASLVDRARALPGVASVALTSWVLLDRGGDVHAVIPEGYQLPEDETAETIFSAVVDEHYFDTMKTGIVARAAFTADDRDGSRARGHRQRGVREDVLARTGSDWQTDTPEQR